MENFLSVLPLIFCFWSGILIAWGSYIGYKNASIIFNVLKMGRAVRSSDIIQLISTTVATSLLLVALFVVPETVSLHLDAILFLEIWYSLFLFYVSEHIFYSNEPVKQIKKSSEHIHFHPHIN